MRDWDISEAGLASHNWDSAFNSEGGLFTLLEVESACHNRLRCGIGRSSKLAWLHIIGIALTTPREDILELMPLDVFIHTDAL